MSVIAIANQKGGVGKTTTTHNIGIALALQGKKVLMVDMDSQASLTISTGIEPCDIAENSIVSVLTDDLAYHKSIKDCIHQTPDGNAAIVPSIIDLADIEWKMFSRVSREKILAREIDTVRNQYDYILIDCPPQLSILTLNALSCADGVIIPVKTDYLAYRGLIHLNDTISEVRAYINPELKIYGVVATMYEKRIKDDTEILALLNQKYNVLSVVNKKALAKKGIYEGLAVVQTSPDVDISIAYRKIAEMIVNNQFERNEVVING